MEFSINPNMRRLYEDIKGREQEYANVSGLKLFYRYLNANMELIDAAFSSFWSNATDDKLLDLSKMQASYVSGKFFKKVVVKIFFEMCFKEVSPNQYLKFIESGFGSEDKYDIEDTMTQAYLTLGAIMHFSKTEGYKPDRTILLKGLERKFKKQISISHFEDNTVIVLIEGGLVEGENEQQFKKVNFSFGNSKLEFQAEAVAPEFYSLPVDYMSLFEKPFIRLIRYPSEMKEKLLNVFRVNDFIINV